MSIKQALKDMGACVGCPHKANCKEECLIIPEEEEGETYEEDELDHLFT